MPEKKVEVSVQGAEEIEGTGSTSWSNRWPGVPDASAITVPRIAPRNLRGLMATIEEEAIPRLVLSQRAIVHDCHTDVAPLAHAGEASVDEFAQLLLRDEIEAAYRYIDSIRVRGVTLQAVYLELLAPAARVLGKMWEDDRCSFADVTVALCRLHEVLRGLSVAQPQEAEATPQGRRVLLVPMPGEQHTFGLLMVSDFFRRSGWEVWSETPRNPGELLGLVRHEWFTMVGLSVGCDVQLDTVASTIHSLRKASRNRALGVMVGGAAFSRQPELAIQVGADATGQDARHAATQAENLVKMFARRC
jgi:MerR family transcriptional regulator, light-induced transcriptional regulator